MNLQIFHWSR